MKTKLFVGAVGIPLIGLTSLPVLASNSSNGAALSSVKVVMPADSPILGQVMSLVSGAPDVDLLNGSNGVVSVAGKNASVSTTAGAQGEVIVNVNNNASAGDYSSVNAVVNINVYVHGGGSATAGGSGTTYFQGGVLTNEMGGLVSSLPIDCGDVAGSQGCWQIASTEATYPLEGGISTSSGENIPFETTTSPPIQNNVVTITPPPPPVVVLPTNPTTASSTQPQQTGSVLNGTYQAGGQTLSLSRITSSGSVSDAVLMGDISNSGWVSNSTIGEGSTLTGGILTGTIINKGAISDVDFRGSSLEGGTLAGTIDNSRGGTIEDVTLEADAHIKGGELTGTVTGDCTAPAVLENVRITADSNVSCVSLQGGSIEEGATVTETEEKPSENEIPESVVEETPPAENEIPESVVEETPVTSEETPPASIVEETTTRSTSETILATSPKASSDLPLLGTAIAVNKKGKSVVSESIFAGGIAIADEEIFQQSGTARKLQDTVDVKADILVDANDIGKKADILIYADYQATEEGELFQLMLDENGSYLKSLL